MMRIIFLHRGLTADSYHTFVPADGTINILIAKYDIYLKGVLKDLRM